MTPRRRTRTAISAVLMIALARSPTVAAIDLDYCAGRPDDNLTPASVYETLPAIELTSSLSRSLAAAEQQSASMQASRERSEQAARASTQSESESTTRSYVTSTQDQRALASTVAAQPRGQKVLGSDVLSQAAAIGVTAAAVEADRLLSTGVAAGIAKRAAQEQGLIAARGALKAAGSIPTAGDIARLRTEIGGRVEAASDTAGVAAWARTTTSSWQQSLSREQASRVESSNSRTSTSSATLSASEQQQRSRTETLSTDVALSVPVRVDFKADLFFILYPNTMPLGRTGDTEDWRYSILPCRVRAQIMSLAAYDALKYVAPRDDALARDVEQAYAMARTGNLLGFIPYVTALAADDRVLAKAAALLILYRIGTVEATWRTGAYANTVFTRQITTRIEALLDLIGRLDDAQRLATGAQLGPALPERMPPLGPQPSVSSTPMTTQEAYAYSTATYFRQRRVQQIMSGQWKQPW